MGTVVIYFGLSYIIKILKYTYKGSLKNIMRALDVHDAHIEKHIQDNHTFKCWFNKLKDSRDSCISNAVVCEKNLR